MKTNKQQAARGIKEGRQPLSKKGVHKAVRLVKITQECMYILYAGLIYNSAKLFMPRSMHH